MRISALLLAGGQSRRLGLDKRFLEFEGKSLLLRACESAAAISDELAVLLSDAEDRQRIQDALGGQAVRFTMDAQPGSGPLGALAGALSHIAGDYALLLAIDYPLITSAFLRELEALLEAQAGRPDVLMPLWQGVPQVTCAFYRKSLAAEIEEAFERGECSLRCWVEGLSAERVMIVPEDKWRAWADETVFLNVNTPEDYDRFLRLAYGAVEMQTPDLNNSR